MAHTVRRPSSFRRKRPAVRRKLSTTVSRETYAYLRNLIRTRRADTLAEAIDLVVSMMRRAENRARLERETAAYFEGLSPEAAEEERSLEAALSANIGEIDFDA